MAKDPAVLFYTSDFLTGTMTMNNEQVGKYIRLLCLQHQRGILTEKDMLNICGTHDEDIISKFKKDRNGYYNERMREEAEKRQRYSESRGRNRTKVTEKQDVSNNHMNNISKSYDNHMENENENINVIEIINELNSICEKNFSLKSKANIKHISARLKDGYTKEQILEVIQLKAMLWKNDIKMNAYLRPETLFNPTKFEAYRQEVEQAKKNPEGFKRQVMKDNGISEMELMKREAEQRLKDAGFN